MSAQTVLLHPADTVVVVVDEADQMRGHKLARTDLAVGDQIVKLGEMIGVATQPIAAGEHVHSHNVAPDRRPVSADDAATNLVAAPESEARTFEGYVRSDGRIGTRNQILVLTTVNCSASVAKLIARRARDLGLADGIDGISALTHQGGCGIGVDSASLANLRRTIAGYATHPNVGGALILGLGCEVNQVAGLLDEYGLVPGDRLRAMTIQEEGGSVATLDAGLAALAELAEVARADRRTTAPASAISLGLQCGGSDGYSAITANPALGRASDLLVGQGGTAVLAETPEMHGAEHLLVRRAVESRRGPAAARPAGVVASVQRTRGQPDAWQQGGRADHDRREVVGRGGQGRNQSARRRAALRRADPAQRIHRDGLARLRPVLGHR